MYRNIRTFIKPEIRLAELIFENPYLLLLLEHFGIDLEMHEKTVSEICLENNISEHVFISFANLYNGFPLSDIRGFEVNDIPSIIRFLGRSHTYFRYDKYPEIQDYLNKLNETNPDAEIRLVNRFFNDYFVEVTDHLDYEEKIAFPYIYGLLNGVETPADKAAVRFSGKEFLDHHTDIESKLTDLKTLMIRHIPLRNDPSNRRKLLFSLIELEFVLNIHSLIEESVLIPLVIELERGRNHG